MRSSIMLVSLFCLLHSNIYSQKHQETSVNNNYNNVITKHVNRENSLSANLANLKKESSQYLVVNDTIYTSSDEVILGLYDYTFWPKYWSIERWVIDCDSIKFIGSVNVNYRGYNARMNKFKFKIKDGYVYWRKRFTRKIRGKFPCSMIDKGGTIYLSDIICHEK